MVDILFTVVAALIGLGILILIHEWGHFLVAKKTGVGVVTFSIGFGPKLWRKKVGETEYALSAFPLGGYVKMVGEDPGEELGAGDRERSFSHQSLGKRAAIVGAGPAFNFFLAILLFALIFMFFGMPVLTTRVGGVEEESPAARGGIQAGDRVVALDGRPVETWEELSGRIKESQGKPMELRLLREGQEVVVSVQPMRREGRNIYGEKTEVWVIGIASEVELQKSAPWTALGEAFWKTGEYSVLTLVALYKMVRGDISPKNLGGPLLIAQMAGQQARRGLVSFFFFIAILSINLGVLNLLPIPVLDGGHLFFFLIEMIIGRPVELRYRERAQQIGVFLLILIMIYALYNDFNRFFEG